MNDKKLTINWVLPRPGLSGGIKSNRLIGEAMVRRGHSVNILFVDSPAPRPPAWRVRTFIRYMMTKLRTRQKQKHHLESSLANLLPVSHQPIRAADAPDADVTIATWWETAHWINDWPASKGKKAYFIRHHEIHGGDPDLVRQTYKLPLQKLVIASWLKRLMQEEYHDPNAVLVPNGVDWEQFSFHVRRKQPIPTVGMLYGIVEWKGARVAFDAIRLVQKLIPELRVICFGSHPIGSASKPPDNFEYHFRPTQEDIPHLYRMTDCWLLPSTIEGFGMPGLEAAACGCPVVSTLCGGPEDYVKDGFNGYLVDVGDAEAIAAKIHQVVTMDTESWQVMSRNSAEYVKRFDWDISAAILEKALFDLVATTNGSNDPPNAETIEQ